MSRIRAVLIAAVLVFSACKKPRPAAPPPEQTRLPPVEVVRGDGGAGSWLFTHVAAQGGFITIDDPAKIPEGARRIVRVIDPSANALERRDSTQVYVVDARELLSRGKAQGTPMSREGFETAALAQLPPGASSLLAAGPTAAPASPEGSSAAEGGTPTQGVPVVVLYGTSWCGACKAARKYLGERKIPFAERDVERDPVAARELADKGARLGVATDRVPILEVRGRLLVGFDPVRLEALLGEAT